jgi:hypothetical protein
MQYLIRRKYLSSYRRTRCLDNEVEGKDDLNYKIYSFKLWICSKYYETT